MLNRKLKISAAAAVFVGASLALTSAATQDPATNAASAKPANRMTELFGDAVLAKGKGVEVKRSALDEEVIRLKAQYAARGQSIPPEHTPMLESQLLDRLIQLQLLSAKATDADRAAAKEMAAKKFADAKTQVGSEEAMDMRLKAENMTRDELLSKWTEAATVDAVLKRELNVKVSDEEIKKYYSDNPARFEQPEMVKASHILLGTRDATNKDLPDDKKAEKRKLAEDLVKRARAGEDFAKLVKQYSEDPGSKDKGGEYTFPRGQMVPEFETAAFSLQTNQVSDIVTTQYGYHVIKLLEKLPAKKMELAAVTSDVKDFLTLQAMQKQIPDYMKKLKADANVEILDEKLKLKETEAPPAAASLPTGHPPVETGKKQ